MQQTKYQTTSLEEPPVYCDNTVEIEGNQKYDTLVNRLKRAKQESSNLFDYVKSSTNIICSSNFVSVGLVFSLIIPIPMLIIGSVYINDCNVERYIPIWMIVTGGCGIIIAVLKSLINFMSFMRYKNQNEEKDDFLATGLNGIACFISIFTFAWFITGCVWVYGNYNNVQFDPLEIVNRINYCHRVCYLFAFWSITFSWIIFAFSICCLFSLLLVGSGAVGSKLRR